MFNSLCKDSIPEALTTHISDDSIIQGLLNAGDLTPPLYRRVCRHIVAAEQAGADFIQLTCSSVSPCADVAQHLVTVPVLKIDAPMVELAVGLHERIGIIATNPVTLKPSTKLAQQTAHALNRKIHIESVLCPGAFDAFLAGRLDEHDKIVTAQLCDLMNNVDIVLLAQASMARVGRHTRQTTKKRPHPF